MQRMLSEREKAIFAFTCGLFVLAVAVNLFLAPVLRRNDSLNREIALVAHRLAKNEALIERKDSLTANYRKYFSGYDIDADKPAQVLSLIEKMALDSGSRIIDIRPQAAKTVKAGKETLIELRLETDMQACLKFLYALERSPAVLSVKRMQLSARPQAGLEASMTISSLETN